jgi:hypothetical protein
MSRLPGRVLNLISCVRLAFSPEATYSYDMAYTLHEYLFFIIAPLIGIMLPGFLRSALSTLMSHKVINLMYFIMYLVTLPR